MKLKWRIYKKYFGKCYMNLISQVEYFSGANLVHISSQFEIEATSILENSECFKLAYSFLLLQSPLLQWFGLCGDTSEAQQLIYDLALIDSIDLPRILSLFSKDNDIKIPSTISLSD